MSKRKHKTGPWVELAERMQDHSRLIGAAPDLYAFAQRVARLNQDAGEIGPGMLAQLVADARRIVGEA